MCVENDQLNLFREVNFFGDNGGGIGKHIFGFSVEHKKQYWQPHPVGAHHPEGLADIAYYLMSLTYTAISFNIHVFPSTSSTNIAYFSPRDK